MPREWDGIISRHINRKFSRPFAKLLVKSPKITPNQITVLSFLVGVFSGVSFFFHRTIMGGLLAQFCSILDGVDGDLAVLTGKISVFGGFLDSLLDRYGDAAILLGMTCHSFIIIDQNLVGVLVGIAALTGSFMVSYSRARAQSNLDVFFKGGFTSYAASRDVRLFIIMLGGILSQTFFTLIILAVLTNFVVLKRLYEAEKVAGYKKT